jgi:glycosyltransferase involved in cell wall biosynthesis
VLGNAPSVALVHDYLNQLGGAERCAVQLTRMWPEAPLYTSLYRADSTFPHFRQVDVRTTWLDRVPMDSGFRSLLPLYPAAFHGLGVLDSPLVLSSSSGWAHGVQTAPGSFHAVYCHTPARWLYGADYLGASWSAHAARPLLRALRRWDVAAARRADLYIANGAVVRDRVRRLYGREAAIVHPPVDVDRFMPRPRGERLLVVSRLLPYKRVDLVVAAATKAGIGLDVVGCGPELESLRTRAGPTVRFHGGVDDGAVRELFESCRAFVLPGNEEFGMTPVEAQAAGKPVIAFAAGGALETVREGRSGVFFHQPTPDALLEAVRRCDDLAADPDELACGARAFSSDAFVERLRTVLHEAGAPDPGWPVAAVPAGSWSGNGRAVRTRE